MKMPKFTVKENVDFKEQPLHQLNLQLEKVLR